VFRVGGRPIHPSILVPLMSMAIAFTLLFLTLHVAGHAQRDPCADAMRSLRLLQAQAHRRREPESLFMNLGPHAAFIIAAYAAGWSSSAR